MALKLEDLEPAHQRLLFLTGQMIREDPLKTQEMLLELWEMAQLVGERKGANDILEIFRRPHG